MVEPAANNGTSNRLRFPKRPSRAPHLSRQDGVTPDAPHRRRNIWEQEVAKRLRELSVASPQCKPRLFFKLKQGNGSRDDQAHAHKPQVMTNRAAVSAYQRARRRGCEAIAAQIA